MISRLLLVAILCLSGCDSLSDYHTRSCGPTAIRALFQNYSIDVSRRTISRDIIAGRSAPARAFEIFGLIDGKVYGITWPSELESELRSRGFRVLEVRGSEDDMIECAAHNAGIALVRDDSVLLRYHWSAYPPSDFIHCFGKDTRIVMLIVVDRRTNP